MRPTACTGKCLWDIKTIEFLSIVFRHVLLETSYAKALSDCHKNIKNYIIHVADMATEEERIVLQKLLNGSLTRPEYLPFYVNEVRVVLIEQFNYVYILTFPNVCRPPSSSTLQRRKS